MTLQKIWERFAAKKPKAGALTTSGVQELAGLLDSLKTETDRWSRRVILEEAAHRLAQVEIELDQAVSLPARQFEKRRAS
ncbi:MAG: hypothetical protein RBT63_09640 [Bdellovibrionales bacterium]|jgi:hypothetical protein|nr:hypothetical protein [Bdellovibrionales bacterium]